MAELLSREREFIKLNEQLNELDRLACTALETSKLKNAKMTSLCKATTSTAQKKVTDERFGTFTKAKGPTTLVRNFTYGASGDAHSRLQFNSPNGDLSQQSPRYNRYTNINRVYDTPVPVCRQEPKRANGFVHKQDESDFNTFVLSKQHGVKSKVIKPADNMRNNSRTSNNRCNGNAFQVKYFNNKFVESPSLNLLIKEESANIREEEGVLNAQQEQEITKTANIKCKKTVSSEGLIKFLKSKIAILEDDHERLTDEMTEQKQIMDKTIERQKKVEQQRDQAILRTTNLTEQIAKLEQQLDENNDRIKHYNVESTVQLKEVERLKRELKVVNVVNSNLEKRLYRATEELEATKSSLCTIRKKERDLHDTYRQDSEMKDKQIKSLKKQRADLLNAYKKQLYLIENLKRQNACMEQANLLNFAEKDLTKLLEWNNTD